MEKVGIYKITNRTNGKIYVGSSIKIESRFLQHKGDLESERHYNQHLQRSWNKYGIENFEFEIIEIVENEENLIEREQYYLDTLNPEYNICEVAGSCLGRTHSEETKKMMSRMRKGEGNPMYGKTHTRDWVEDHRERVKGENNPFYGRKHSEETKRKIGEKSKGRFFSKEARDKISKSELGEKNGNSKLTKDDVIKIRKLNREMKDDMTNKDKFKKLSEMFGVTAKNIDYIIKRKTWKHIKEV